MTVPRRRPHGRRLSDLLAAPRGFNIDQEVTDRAVDGDPGDVRTFVSLTIAISAVIQAIAEQTERVTGGEAAMVASQPYWRDRDQRKDVEALRDALYVLTERQAALPNGD